MIDSNSPLLTLNSSQFLTLLKVCREFKGNMKFMRVQADICSLLTKNIDQLSLPDALGGLCDLDYDKVYYKEVGEYVRAVDRKILGKVEEFVGKVRENSGQSNPEELSTLDILSNPDHVAALVQRSELASICTMDLVHALDCFSSWDVAHPERRVEYNQAHNLKNTKSNESSASSTESDLSLPESSPVESDLPKSTDFNNFTSNENIEALGLILADRIAEIKYSPNVALFQSITTALGRLHYYHQEWMRQLTPIARDKFMLDRISFFQQCALADAMGKLKFE
jgi:hypothetical protein